MVAEQRTRPQLVLFCGAGISIGAGFPGMATFPDALRAAHLLNDDEQHDFDAIQAHCNDLAVLTGGTARNIEQLASILSILQLSRPSFQFAECRRYRLPREALGLIRRSLHLMYSRMSPNDNWTARELIYLINEYDLMFVTTNYDINIEASASLMGFRVNVTLPGRHSFSQATPPTPGNQCLYRGQLHPEGGRENRYIKLAKLHGSTNWYNGPDGTIVDNAVMPTTVNTTTGAWGGFQFATALGSTSWKQPENALIVPPTAIKSSSFSPLAEQWITAADAMSQAHYVAFIGYSFPESDSFMKMFIATSLHRNSALKRIVVIDPDALEIRPRIQPLLSHPQHVDACELFPVPFQGQPLADMVSGRWSLANDPGKLAHIRAVSEARLIVSGRKHT